MSERFDFEGFRRASMAKDAGAWAAFYADEAEWIEYKPTHPPRSPRRMAGRAEIDAFLRDVCEDDLTIDVGDEVLGDGRSSLRMTVELPDGRRIIEHAIIEHRGGLITRQVEVEAWDAAD